MTLIPEFYALAREIKTNGALPASYLTKTEAAALGWSGGSLDRIIPGKQIGGDRYYNLSGILPSGVYTECDLGTIGKNGRGQYRLVYSADFRFYVTINHYQSFVRIRV